MIDINLILTFSLLVLAFVSFCLFIFVVPVVIQLSRTLHALERVLDLVNEDVEPVLRELKVNLLEIKNKIDEGRTTMRTVFDKTKIVLLSSAYGILYGIKDYLQYTRLEKTSYNGRGEKGKKEETSIFND